MVEASSSRVVTIMGELVALRGQLESYKLDHVMTKVVVPFCDTHFDEVQGYLTTSGNVVSTIRLMGFTVVRVRSILAPGIGCFICHTDVQGECYA